MQVGSGDRVAVYTADMRRRVSFTFYPEGYDWVESTPSLLSEGLSGRGGGAGARQSAGALPDRFRLVRPGSTIPVDVFIQRDIEWGAWLLGAKVGWLGPVSISGRPDLLLGSQGQNSAVG